MKVVAILQQRLGNTRLHRKGLLMLAGKTMDQNIVERVQRSTRIHEVVMAFPLRDYESFQYLQQTGCSLYAYPGDENDLVGRYLGAAQAFGADLIVRIPCDNPCVHHEYIDDAIRSYLALPRVYVSTMFAHVRDRVYFDGIGAEVISYSRLQWLDQATAGDAYRREHPHMLFQDQHLIDGWEQYQRYANVSETIRLDVNEEKDYLFIKDIYSHFGSNDFTAAEIVAYLDSKKVPA